MLKQKIENRSAHIGVVGLGYVGLPLALRFSAVGFKVTGFDVDASKPDQLALGHSYISHIQDKEIRVASDQGFRATTDYNLARELDVIIICVPTPLTPEREPDLQFIRGTVESLLPNLRKNQLVCLESTSYPGTTEEELQEKLEAAGFVVGEDIFVAYSPEREDPGNPEHSISTIPKIVSGCSDTCLELAICLYESAVKTVVPVSSTRVAEAAKLLENIHRAVNIGLVNEMKIVADAMDIDIYEVIEAASSKPFGFTPYFPGPGLGGHCLPIDPYYFSWKAKQYGVDSEFIRLAGEVNSEMPAWVVSKVVTALHPKSIDECKVLVIGAAYKKNIGDTRESPAIEIMDQLIQLGADVTYHDPYVPALPSMRKYNLELHSTECDQKSLSHADVVVIATNHDNLDYELILQHSNLVVDTRGVFKPGNKVISA